MKVYATHGLQPTHNPAMTSLCTHVHVRYMRTLFCRTCKNRALSLTRDDYWNWIPNRSNLAEMEMTLNHE